MADREKVIKGLEKCSISDGLADCRSCPYFGDNCAENLCRDAIELLKEQEAVKPKSKTRHGATTQVQHWCGACMAMLHGKPNYCPNCGRKVKW